MPHIGLVIDKSCRIAPGQYLLAGGDGVERPAITIRGSGIVVDFQGAVLRGTPNTAEPDQRKGLGVLVEGPNITVRNAQVHGYKVAILARNSPGLKVLDSDLSYNWKQRLQSTLERESGADWMSFHRNENDEWLRFGAALYLRNSPKYEVKNVRATGGQCGLMMTNCDQGLVWNCDFSFLSAIGIGMYRSSQNRILHNNVDWCVRGFSYGVYNRGQDSAGILIYEQSSHNVFAYNSVTHGGDGFFLWAGQTTLDTAEGGCNDNLLYGNDFSHAPTNAIEATFSRNRFINNLLVENWHGIWGGYSYDSQIVGNVFAYNGEGIAIEHGQSNRIAFNAFERDNVGVYCWQNPRSRAWGYSLGKDTSSRDGIIESNAFRSISTIAVDLRSSKGFSVRGNLFERNGSVLRLRNVDDLTVSDNTIYGPKEEWPTEIAGQLAGNRWTVDGSRALPAPSPAMARTGRDLLELEPAFRDDLKRFDLPWNPWPDKPVLSKLVSSALPSDAAQKAEAEVRAAAPAPLAGGKNPFLPKGTLRGRRYILVDEWGPYDFLRPLLWARETVVDRKSGESVRTYEVLGPKGRWKLVGKPKDVSLDEKEGAVPGFIRVRLPKQGAVDFDLRLEYRGGATTDVRGIVAPAGQAVPFGLHEFQVPISWRVRYFSYDPDREDPRTQKEAFARALQRKPVADARLAELAWSGRPSESVPPEYFATSAVGSFSVPEGAYVIEITADDGVRAYLDGKPLVTDGWKYQNPTVYRAPVRLNGSHTLKVEHFQLTGYATLQVRIVPEGR